MQNDLMSCNLKLVVCELSKIEQGEPSYIPEGNQTDDDIDDHQDLAILRSMWNFKCKSGNLK